MLHQIIYLRAGNGRNLLQKGNLAMGEGNKVFSFSQPVVTDEGYDFNFYNTYISQPKPSYVKISDLDKRETFTDNAYSYYVPQNGYPIFTKWLYIPREYAKDGRGTFLNYGLIGELGFYPCVYFETPSVDEVTDIDGNVYRTKINSKEEDVEYYKFRFSEMPGWLSSIEEDSLKWNSEYSFNNIGNWIIENNYQEKLQNAVAFCIRQLRVSPKEREFIIIRDTEINVRKWISAIEYAFPVSVALKLPFATRLTDCHKKGNLYFVDQNGKYLVTGRNDQKKVLAVIVGSDTRDPQTKNIHPLPNSEFLFLEDLNEYCADDYFDLIIKFDEAHYTFTQDFLSTSKINIEDLDMAALYKLYRYFNELKADNIDINELYINLLAAEKLNIVNIENFDLIDKYSKRLAFLSEHLNKREIVTFVAVVARIYKETAENVTISYFEEVYNNLYTVFSQIFHDGDTVTEKSLGELWNMVGNISKEFSKRLKEDLFSDKAMVNYTFKYHVTVAGQLRNQAEVEEEATTIKTLLKFYYNALVETEGAVLFGNGLKYVINGLYALYVIYGRGEIQYDDMVEIVELFSDTNINHQGMDLFRNINFNDTTFKDCLYKCTISSRTYDTAQDIKFECDCRTDYEEVEQFISQMYGAKKCPVTENELYKMLIGYANKYKKIKGNAFEYPCGLKFYEKIVLKSDNENRLKLLSQLQTVKPSLDDVSKAELYKLISEKVEYTFEKDDINLKLSNKLFELGFHSQKIDLLALYDLLRSYQPRSVTIFPKLADIYNAKCMSNMDVDYFVNLVGLLERLKLDIRIHVYLLALLITSNNPEFEITYITKLWKTPTLDNTPLFVALVKVVYDFTQMVNKKVKIEGYDVIFAGNDLSHPSVIDHFAQNFATVLRKIHSTLSEKEQKLFHRQFNKNEILLDYFKNNILTGELNKQEQTAQKPKGGGLFGRK
ncbi:MAG: hypothetical protein LBM93_02875 [Oscillospiraceae bacterium]|jgi:hypothetical protein|nr:hypothetical protein [Oscillospiraceae bacterium]